MNQADEKSRRAFLKTGSILGLAVALNPGTIAEAFTGSNLTTTQKENIMTQTATTAAEQATDKTAIRPFQFNFPDAELIDLRRRINTTNGRARTRKRCITRCAARNDAETRALLGN